MRAVWYERNGSAREVLTVGEIETPLPGSGEVRVRVAVSGANPSDVKRRSNWSGTGMEFPRIIPHSDGAGVIDQVGPDVPTNRIGERVWVYEAQWHRPFGTAAEYVVVPAQRGVRLPDGIDFATGACLGIPAMTAHRCLFADGPIEGQTILITGGAGTVGNMAIQLAKWGGANVITTISNEEKAALARDAGADHVLNYRSQDIKAVVMNLTGDAGVDRVVDVDFGFNLPTTVQVIKPNGTIAAYASMTEPKPSLPFYALMNKNATVRLTLVYDMPEPAKQQACADVTKLLAKGRLRAPIGARFPLERTADAHEALEQSAAVGNVVVEIT